MAVSKQYGPRVQVGRGRDGHTRVSKIEAPFMVDERSLQFAGPTGLGTQGRPLVRSHVVAIRLSRRRFPKIDLGQSSGH